MCETVTNKDIIKSQLIEINESLKDIAISLRVLSERDIKHTHKVTYADKYFAPSDISDK